MNLDAAIKSYNKKAKRWGYNSIIHTDGYIMLNGFTPQYHGGKIKSIKDLPVLYHDGVMFTAYNQIRDECVSRGLML